METDLIWQYALITVVFIAVIIVVARNLLCRRKKSGAGGCAGCPLSEACSKCNTSKGD